MNEQENFVTCSCRNCNGNIEFDTSLLQSGTMVTCPHCETETPLFIPNVPKTDEKIVEKAPEKTAKLIEEKVKTYSGGMEDTLEDVGGIFLFLGLLGGIAAIIMGVIAFNNSDHDETGIGVDLLCIGFISILAGAVNRIFLRAGAEMIRLLKKIAGLKFSGKITEPVASNDSFYKCSACKEPAYSWSEECTSCGAKFKK